MFLLRIFIFLLPFCWVFECLGQDSSIADLGYDTAYIETFRDKMIVTLVCAKNSNTISVNDKKGNSVGFGTNVPMSFGFAVDYKWLTVELTSSLGRSGPEKYGYTNMKSVGFGLTGRKVWFRNFFQRSQGYYLTNPEYFSPAFNPIVDDYPHRSDLVSTIYFANLNYGFNNRKFSNMASLWQIERQKKSAGSFTAGLSFAYASYNADSALIPEKYQDLFPAKEFVTGYYFTVIGVNGGYLYTLLFGHKSRLFMSAALIPGLSYQTGKAYSEDGQLSPRQNGIGGLVEGRLVTGYNADVWYTTMSFVGYSIASNFKDKNPMSQAYSFVRFVVGYKFDVPDSKSPLLKKIGL